MPKIDIEVNGQKITVEGDVTVRILPTGAVEIAAKRDPEPEQTKPAVNDQFETMRKIADELRKFKEKHPDPPNPFDLRYPVYPDLPWERYPRSRPVWIADFGPLGKMQVEVDPNLPKDAWCLKAR